MYEKSLHLGDFSYPRGDRQQALTELLSMDDFEATMAAAAAFSVPGATFEGQPIPESSAAAFSMGYYIAA